MCTIHCWLIFCISPRPGHHRPTIGRAKQHDNAMRCALVSISSDGSDLQLLPASPFVQIRSEHSSNPAVNCSCSTNTYPLVYLWKLEKPPIKFISSRLCLMSTDKGSYFLYVLDCFQIRILNLHTLVIKAKHKIIIISKLTEPICVVQCPRPPAPPQLRTTRSVRVWAAACHLTIIMLVPAG